MAKYTAAYTFQTNVMLGGRINVVACIAGDVIELDDDLAAEVKIQVPGALTKAAKAPKVLESPELVDIETAPGLTAEAETRAVVGTKKKAKK